MLKRIFRLAVAMALVSCAGRSASAAPFIFGFTGDIPDAAVLSINGGALVFSVSDSQIDPGVNNAGWWPASGDNHDDNDNYIVGGGYHNFFTFDLGSLDVAVTSAELSIARSSICANDTSNGGCYPPTTAIPFGSVEYSLWDVTTDYITLNNNVGHDAAIFDDLGSGVLFGAVLVPDDGSPNPLLISLNADAVDAINAARGGFFSVGGALPPLPAVPEPATLLLLAVGGVAAQVRARAQKRRAIRSF